MLLIQAVVTKNDREEALMEHLVKLAAKLPVIDFYNTTFPTPKMKVTIANLYSEVMNFLDNALSYYHGGRLGLYLVKEVYVDLCEWLLTQRHSEARRCIASHEA